MRLVNMAWGSNIDQMLTSIEYYCINIAYHWLVYPIGIIDIQLHWFPIPYFGGVSGPSNGSPLRGPPRAAPSPGQGPVVKQYWWWNELGNFVRLLIGNSIQ